VGRGKDNRDYDEDGSNRRGNITDWAWAQFREKYGAGVSKWDIFHYVYAVLHHPEYRKRYAGNLKKELPRIPMLALTPSPSPAGRGGLPSPSGGRVGDRGELFARLARLGQTLARLHLTYEQADEYKLEWIESGEARFSWRVEKVQAVKELALIPV
jgi:predicted helicase